MANNLYKIALDTLKDKTSSIASIGKMASKVGDDFKAMLPAKTPTSDETNIVNILNNTDSTGGAASTALSTIKTSDISLTDGMNISLSKSESMLAIPTFSSGPNDKLASVDIYSLSGSGGRSINSILAKTSLPAAEQLKGSDAGVSKLNDILNKSLNSIKLDDLKNPTTLLDKALPGFLTGANKLSKPCGSNSFLDNILKDLSGKKHKSTSGYGIKNSDLSCVMAVGDIVNNLAKANGCPESPFGVSDKDAKSSAIKNAGLLGAKFAIPNIFGSLICGINDIFSINKAATDLIGPVVKNGDLKSLKTMALSTTTGILKKSAPSLIKEFSGNFSKVFAGVSDGANTSKIDMLSSFKTIDTDWLSTDTTGNGKIGSLHNVIGASDDFNSFTREGIYLDSITTPVSNSNGIFTNSITALSNNAVDNQDILYSSLVSNDTNTVAKAISNSFPDTTLSFSSDKSLLNNTEAIVAIKDSVVSLPIDKNITSNTNLYTEALNMFSSKEKIDSKSIISTPNTDGSRLWELTTTTSPMFSGVGSKTTVTKSTFNVVSMNGIVMPMQ